MRKAEGSSESRLDLQVQARRICGILALAKQLILMLLCRLVLFSCREKLTRWPFTHLGSSSGLYGLLYAIFAVCVESSCG